MLRTLRRFAKGKSGATAIEYGLIAALISVAAIGGIDNFGGSLIDMFNGVSGSVDTAVEEAKVE